ncbi:4abe07ea-01ea-44a9-b2c2-868aba383669 [Thermothielavioides terrestris]|uniref:4abe07ea-01ea-44a9-b2c2-868aba383669 n=1 Tax=Thermothielavioides terrestris TaxID=2587410 RepID=A0A3S4CBI1_9PEZI|nr:4abe07ea-01ea-44a9-b2c2-868aba383669 [Thermothielavioides terrestris]
MAPFPPLPNLTPNLPSPRAILITAAANLDPTKTLPDLLHGLQIHPRQTTSAPGATVTVVSSGPTSSTTDPNETTTLSGGAIAGSVIGSIAGFLLLFWIVRSCTNLGAPPGEVESLPPRRPWYAGVRAEYPDERCPPAGYGKSRGRGDWDPASWRTRVKDLSVSDSRVAGCSRYVIGRWLDIATAEHAVMKAHEMAGFEKSSDAVDD